MVGLARGGETTGNFELQIDGHAPCAYIRSVDGGWSRGTLGPDTDAHPSAVKQVTTIEIEPLTVELGLLGSPGMLSWIQRAWARCPTQRRNGQISYADFHLRTVFEHEFFRALLTKVVFPGLDAASKEAGYLQCTLQPEHVVTRSLPLPGAAVSGIASARQKLWTPSAFRFHIDGIPGMEYTSSLDSFTVAMETSKLHTGASRIAELEPRALKFPNLTGAIPLARADALIQWHQAYIHGMYGGGTRDDRALKTGAIELLTPDRKQTILRIRLHDVGVVHVAPVKATANAEPIGRVKFELYVGQMTLEGSALAGFA
jgi:hypothetical protein